MVTRAFFFDRDGIVNKRIIGDYVKKVEEFEMIPDFPMFLKMVKDAGYLAILVTNQQGIGKGLMTVDDLAQVHNHMQRLLLKEVGYGFDDIYFCPELAGTNSMCRKPNPGMFFDAILKWKIMTGFSYTIGDDIKDVKAGKEVGTHNILIGNQKKEDVPEADEIFPNLIEAQDYLAFRI